MLTLSSLRNDVIQCRIAGAMRKAIANSRQWSGDGKSYVHNRYGRLIFSVIYSRKERAGKAFSFYAGNRNITDIVIASLREGQLTEEENDTSIVSLPKAVFSEGKVVNTHWHIKANKAFNASLNCSRLFG